MSLLDELQHKRKQLKPCTTCVTTASGLTYTEQLLADGSIASTRLQPSSSPGFVVDTKPDLQVAWVLPGLALGSQDVAQDAKLLQENEFTHVLSLGIEVGHISERINFKFVNVLDLPETKLEDVLECCLDFIDEARSNGRVFVHCNAGVSRSASVVIAYLMREGHSYEEAYTFLKEKRSVIRPNDGFVRQLKELEKTLQRNRIEIQKMFN